MKSITTFPVARDVDGLARIGRSLHDLRGLRFAEGEENAQPAPVVPTPAAPATPAPAAPADAVPLAPPASESAPWTEADFDPERAWRKIQAQKADLEALRKKKDLDVTAISAEAAQKARDEFAQSIGKAIGLVKAEETPTVEELSQTLQERDSTLTKTQAELTAARAETAVLRFATKHNGDADAILDSRGFATKLAGLDSSSDDYATQVEALVKAEIESNPRYRTVQVAAKSSDGDAPPAGGNPAPTVGIESHRAAYAKRREARD